MIKQLIRDLKISRPGLWFATVWIYLVPLRITDQFWDESTFWIGFFFVCFPLNYLVYGLNDYNDFNADQINDRKGNFLFGAKASQKILKSIPKKIALVLLPFMVYFVFITGLEMLVLLTAMIVVNVVYNFQPFRIKERPPFEIFIQLGYVLTAIFSVSLNQAEMIPWQTIVYLGLFAFQAHIAGEIMDIEPDRKAKKRTTATVIGRKKTKYLMILLLSMEVFLLVYWFQDYILSAFLGAFAVWLLLDVLIFYKENPYSQNEMKLFGVAINVVAVASMFWVLYSETLLSPKY